MNDLQIDPKFDVFKLNEYQDESIEQYDAREYYQPTGKSLTNYRGTKLRIQTKGDHLMNIAEGLLEVDVNVRNTIVAANATRYFINDENKVFWINEGAGILDKALNVGPYNDIAALLAQLRAQIGANGANYTLAVDGNGVHTLTVANVANRSIRLGIGLATYLGFAVGQVGVADELNEGTFLGINANVVGRHSSTNRNYAKLNPNPMSLFRKATLLINNIEIHAIDFPSVPYFISQATKYSSDYQTKRKDLHMFYDRSPTVTQYADATIENDVNFLEYSQREQKVNINVADGDDRGGRFLCNIKLKDIFPYFKSFDKATRGLVYTIELDINPDSHQVLPKACETAASVNNLFKIDNLSLWVPNIKASVTAEAALIEDMKQNKEGMVVHYENPQVYRTLHAPTTSFTYVIDSVAKIPKRLYIGFQRANQLDKCQGELSNPTTYKHFKMRTAELRIGSDVWPRQPHAINFESSTLGTAMNYERLYTDLYSAGMAQELDNGGLISFKDYRDCYPIVCFNVEREGVLQVEDQINDITVNFTFKENQPTDFYATAVIVYDDSIAIRTDGLSRLKLSK